MRRVVIDADGVVVDMGRRRRLFTGPAQLAARLNATECYWPGCHVPTTSTQTDHLEPWTDGGTTDLTNAGPACARHNRLKHHGYTVHRDPAGTWHTHRPDGTEIT
ncbi:MAG TPA: HNH endonuclease signature motif containing protein [Aquihabitans sp.]|nr:HNH endonuclease signature motif containing protein [Aquihabitans sp.]